jgi:putative ABC transport system permease protein
MSLLQDLRFALRGLARSPGFTAVAVTTLALVIGTNTAVFSLVRGVVYRSVEVEDIDSLVAIAARSPGDGNRLVAPGTFLDWQKESQSFSGLAASETGQAVLVAAGGPEQVAITRVTPDFFDVLQARTVLGTTFGRQEIDARNDALAVISEGLWTRLFANDAQVLGKSIQLGPRRLTVAGVMSGNFAYPLSTDIWVPFTRSEFPPDERKNPSVRVVGRLKPNVLYAAAEAELGGLHDRLKRIHSDMDPGAQVELGLFSAMDNQWVGRVLVIVMMASYLLLMIGCANLATQLLARAVNRRKEIATRISVGGGRRRIIQQLLTESVTLSVLGAAAGLLIALWMLSLAKGTFSFLGMLPGFRNAGIDGATLIYTAALAVGTGLVFGLVPAIQLARTDLNEVLKESGRGHTGGRSTKRLRDALIAVQVALAVVVTFGAVTFMHMLDRVLREKGFRSEGLAYAQLDFAANGHTDYQHTDELSDAILAGARRLPGVTSAALALPEPYSRQRYMVKVELEGLAAAAERVVHRRAITGEFFNTMQVSLRRGRSFTPSDRDGAPLVAIVSASFAERLMPGRDPIGRRFRPDDDTAWWTIVGVASDVEHAPGEGMTPTIYVPSLQSKMPSATFIVRTSGDPKDLLQGMRTVIGEASKGKQPIAALGTYDDKIADLTVGQRLLSTVTVIFAIIALVIAAVGLNGAVAFQVAERSNELGVRMALGATPAQIGRAVLTRGLLPLAAGIVLGVGAAKPTAAFLSALVQSGTELETVLLVVAPLLVLLVAWFGALLPTLKAALRDPVHVLRHD